MNRRCWLYCGLVVLGCGDDDGGGGGGVSATRVTQKLRECDILGQGEYNPAAIEDSYDRCIVACVLTADCDDIRRLYCDEGPGNDLQDCAGKCDETPTDGFECDGGGRIPHNFVCDGEQDCEEGDDEEDCEPYECDDGEEIVYGVRCDAIADCGDGSDEDGCAPACE